jgi:hypothetical protein
MAKEPPKRKRKDQSKRLERKMVYKDRQISYREGRDSIQLQIAGVPIRGVARLGDGQYHTQFFPFRSFPTIEVLAKALVDTEGQLWVLSKEGQHHR